MYCMVQPAQWRVPCLCPAIHEACKCCSRQHQSACHASYSYNPHTPACWMRLRQAHSAHCYQLTSHSKVLMHGHHKLAPFVASLAPRQPPSDARCVLQTSMSLARCACSQPYHCPGHETGIHSVTSTQPGPVPTTNTTTDKHLKTQPATLNDVDWVVCMHGKHRVHQHPIG